MQHDSIALLKTMKTTVCYLSNKKPSLKGAMEMAYFHECSVAPNVGDSVELRPQIPRGSNVQKVIRGPVIFVEHSINENTGEHKISIVIDPVDVGVIS